MMQSFPDHHSVALTHSRSEKLSRGERDGVTALLWQTVSVAVCPHGNAAAVERSSCVCVCVCALTDVKQIQTFGFAVVAPTDCCRNWIFNTSVL